MISRRDLALSPPVHPTRMRPVRQLNCTAEPLFARRRLHAQLSGIRVTDTLSFSYFYGPSVLALLAVSRRPSADMA